MQSLSSSTPFSRPFLALCAWFQSFWLIVAFGALAATTAFAANATYPPIDTTNFPANTTVVSGATWGYRYLPPATIVPGAQYPLIIFLHGDGEVGTNNTSQLTAGGNTANGALGLVATYNPNNGLNERTAYPCFFVAPQRPNGRGWDQTSSHFDVVINNIISFLNTTYPSSIDMNRICLTGLSGGGGGTWMVPDFMPTTFSCVVPVSANAGSTLGMFPRIPAWAFHAANDTTVTVGGGDSAIAYLRNRGQTAVYTRYNTGGHSTQTWGAAYLTPTLLPWIFAQRKNYPVQGLPGNVPNIIVTGTTHGSNFSLTAIAPSDVTRVGWTKNTVGNSGSKTDGVYTGTNLNSASSTFTAANVGNRVGINVSSSLSYQTYYDVTGFVDSHDITLGATPLSGSASTFTLFSLGYYLNPSPGTLTGGIWSMSAISLASGFQAVMPIAELPSYNTTNGGNTTVNFSIPIVHVSPSGDTTAPNIAITTPATATSTTGSALTISGTASDNVGIPSGTISWSSNFGFSGTAAISGGTWSIPNVPMVAGDNVFTVSASDAQNNTSTATVVVTYTGTSANQAPIISAGAYQWITWPTATVTLAGTVYDDGLPPSSTVTTSWSKVSGPGSVQFSDASSLTSTATFSQIGTYILRLTVSDTALTSTKDVAITVEPSGTFAAGIDCGSTASFTGTDGTVYSADILTGGTTGLNNAGIANTSDTALYQKFRTGTFTYSVPLSNGTYDLVLKFAETSNVQYIGMRVFNVLVQGSTAVSNLDIFSRVGPFAAFDYVVPGVVVSNGTMTISTSPIVGSGVLNAILIRASAAQVAPSITNGPPSLSATVGTAYSTFTYTASGTPTPTFTLIAGSLPPGLTLSGSGTISGTPTMAGIYSSTVSANNSAGSDSQSFSIAVSGVYNQWATNYFGGAGSGTSGPTATPQNDGVPNLLKYLFDINPTVLLTAADRAAMPHPGMTTISNVPYLTLTYRQNASASDLTVHVQKSTDLVTWTTVTPDFSQNVGTDPITHDPILQVGVNASGGGRMFIRLNVAIP